MVRIKLLLFAFIISTGITWAQETAHYTNDMAAYYHALELYQNKAYVASKVAFQEAAHSFDDFSEMRANCDYYVANCAVRLGEQNADALVQDFVDKYPNSTKRNDAFMEVANYYYDTGKYAHALKWLGRVKYKNMPHGTYENYLFKYGYALFATGNLTQSKEYFVQLIDSQEYGAQAKYYYGYVAYQQDDYQNAEEYLGQVSGDKNYDKEVSYYLADMNFKLGKFQKAIDAALPLLPNANHRDKSEINKIIGESYFNLAQYQEAIPYLQEYKGKRGKWTNTDYYLLGYSYYKQQDYENAIKQFNKIIDGNNAVAQNAYYHLAECYLKTNKKTEALNAFMNASQMDFKPQIKEDAYLNYAKLSYEIGNPYKNVAEVLQDFLNAYPNTPEKENIKDLIVSAFIQSQDYQGAINYLEKEHKNKNNATYQKIAFERGIQLYKNGKYKVAKENFEKSLTNSVLPEYTAKATYWKGQSAYQNQDYTEALSDFTTFKNLPSAGNTQESGDINYQIAYVYFKQKKYQDASQYFKNYVNQSVSNQEKYQDAYLRLADTYYVSKNYSQAYQSYQKAKKENNKVADYATFQSAICEGFLGNTSHKIELLESIPVTYPRSGYKDEALYVLGTTYTDINQPQKALDAYDRLINQLSRSSFVPRALLKKGLIYYNENKIEEALNTYKLAVSKYPNTAIAQEAVQNARRIYISTGRVDEYADWVKGLDFVNVTNTELDKDMYDAAERQYVMGDYGKAISAFNKYLQNFPSGLRALEAHFYLAQSFDNQNKEDIAIEHYTYVANQPTNEFTEESLVKLTQFLLNKDQWSQATPHLLTLENVATHSQNVLYAQSNLMKSYYQSEDYTQAVVYAEKSLQHPLADNQVKADAQIIVARAAWQTGDTAKARSAYKNVESIATGELMAEALYYDAYFKNLDGNFKNSNVVVQKIASDYASYKKWGAKSLIVMAKNFYGLNDAYQATYILDNVIQNFPQFPDVVQEAKDELAKIKAEQAKTNDSVIPD
jgi:TolA-binding protein